MRPGTDCHPSLTARRGLAAQATETMSDAPHAERAVSVVLVMLQAPAAAGATVMRPSWMAWVKAAKSASFCWAYERANWPMARSKVSVSPR